MDSRASVCKLVHIHYRYLTKSLLIPKEQNVKLPYRIGLKIVQWTIFLVRHTRVCCPSAIISFSIADKHRVPLKKSHPDYIQASFVNVRLTIMFLLGSMLTACTRIHKTNAQHFLHSVVITLKYCNSFHWVHTCIVQFSNDVITYNVHACIRVSDVIITIMLCFDWFVQGMMQA